MKYLCLIYDEREEWRRCPRPESEAIMGEYFAFTDDIQKSGQYMRGEALQPVQHGHDRADPQRQGLDHDRRPFAETKEQLGGYYLIEAKDLNDAIQVASRIPSVRHRQHRGAAGGGLLSQAVSGPCGRTGA